MLFRVTRAESAFQDLDELDEVEGADDRFFAGRNTVHDRSQFESTFHFDLSKRNGERARRYDIEFYLFLPTAMGITPEAYSREQFYADLTSYLRLKAPRAGVRPTPGGELVHFPAAEAYFEVHLAPLKRQKLAAAVIHEVKLFGCHVNTRLKDLLAIATAAREVPPDADDLRRRLLRVSELVEGFRRRYLQCARHEPVLLDDEVKRVFLLVDEYLSYRIDATIIQLRDRLSRSGAAPEDLVLWLDVVLKHEHAHRRENGLVTLEAGPDQARRLEAYYYRLGLLKKYVTEVLFIETDHMARDAFYRNVVAAFCAMLAATWAAVADLQRMQLLGGGGSTWRLVMVILLGVVAYAFKDRIKELTRHYFNERLKGYLPDYHSRMTYERVDELGRAESVELGTSREFMRYLKRTAVPADIRYVRECEKRSDLDPQRNEFALHYARRLTFGCTGEPELQHVKNILRFDISDFLDKLDNPKKPLVYFDPQAGLRHVDAPKVYHINVVVRHAVADLVAGASPRAHVEYERFRVVLNKKGIRRIETVVRRGELRYDEELDARR